MQELRQSTAFTWKAGPFLDEDDGKTVETALTITQPDVRLSKNGGNYAQKSAAGTATHDEKGFYDISLSTTDTNTLGRLKCNVHETGALPVFETFMVISKEEYDAKYGVDAHGADHLVKLAVNGAFKERTGIESGTIDRTGYPHYGAIFTYTSEGGSNLDFDPDILEGAIIENIALLTAGQERFFKILGGYYFNDTSDTVSKVFGIALDLKFGITEGGSTTIDSNWDGFDIDEPGNGSGWTFIVAAKSVTDDETATFPDSDDILKIWLNPAYQRGLYKHLDGGRYPDGAAYYKGNSGFTDTLIPAGTPTHPVNSFDDLRTIANNYNLHTMKIDLGGADRTATGAKLDNNRVIGISPKNSVAKLIINTVCAKAYFENLKLKQTVEETEDCFFLYCSFVDNMFFEKCLAIHCNIESTTVIKPYQTGADSIFHCSFETGSSIDYTAAGTTKIVNLSNCWGKLIIKNITNASQKLYIEGFEGEIEIQSSCTAANENILISGGKGKITDNSTTGTVKIEGFIDRFNVMTEDDGGIPRFTANALEQAQGAAAAAIATAFTFTGGNVHSNVEMIDTQLVKDDNNGHLLVKNEDNAKIGTDTNQTTIINHLADIKGAGWGVNDNLKDIRADTNEIQSKLPSGNIAGPGDKMDLIDELKNISGSSGYDRTTDSLEALGAAIVDKAKLKDIIFNRDVLTRHPSGPGAGKPKTISVGAGGAEGTITTTLDGEHVDTETIA